LRFSGKDADSKENHCDIFATINRHPKFKRGPKAIKPGSIRLMRTL